MMTKEIKKQEVKNEIQVFTQSKSMGVADDLTPNDVQIPSLMLMQANAELVKDRSNDVKSGDFVNSINQEIWGSVDSPVQLCVVDMFKTEVITQIEGNKWISTRQWTPDMENMPYEFEDENKKKCKRQKCYNYICFRPLDIREINLPNGETHYIASPIVVKFKGMSGKNAKKFNQLLKDYAMFKQPSFSMTFDLIAYEDSNEHGSFFVYDFKNMRQAIKETQMAGASMAEMSQAARSSGIIDVIDAEEVSVEKEVKSSQGAPLPNHAPQGPVKKEIY